MLLSFYLHGLFLFILPLCFLGSSVKYLFRKYSGPVKVERDAKSHKGLDVKREQEVAWVRSTWAEKHKGKF